MIPDKVRIQALRLVDEGVSRSETCQITGVKKTTLATWLGLRKEGHIFGLRRLPAVDALPGRKVGELRSVLRILDTGQPLRQIERDTGIDRQTLRKWRDEPRFREATYEHDPLFTYDENDLMDRAVVAQHLCSLTDSIDERLELMLAAVGIAREDMDDNSAPQRGLLTLTLGQARIRNRKGIV